MENFIVSARKYRPASFDTVVGQLAITSTLRNAIVNHQLAQAYLFTGPRGVGKTTCARIFAKTINCLNLQPNAEPCNECESCKAFNAGRSLNIHELDAASNNSVDDIRGLVEQVRILPQVGKYSVYIIDEVHMLSTSAFNAFLKTLEEPPAHAIFILATTEKHKILPTILSRCQIYDFNRMKVGDTVEHLKYISAKEGITAEEAALDVIAQKADGAMRDALSIFDQVVSFCGKNLTYEKVIENLNVLDYDYYFRLTDLFNAGKVGEAFLLFQSRQHPRLGLNDSAQPRLNIDLRLPAVDLAGVGVVALAELVDLVVQDLRFDAVGAAVQFGVLGPVMAAGAVLGLDVFAHDLVGDGVQFPHRVALVAGNIHRIKAGLRALDHAQG